MKVRIEKLIIYYFSIVIIGAIAFENLYFFSFFNEGNPYRAFLFKFLYMFNLIAIFSSALFYFYYF